MGTYPCSNSFLDAIYFGSRVIPVGVAKAGLGAVPIMGAMLMAVRRCRSAANPVRGCVPSPIWFPVRRVPLFILPAVISALRESVADWRSCSGPLGASCSPLPRSCACCAARALVGVPLSHCLVQ